jgi:hypothetical protein
MGFDIHVPVADDLMAAAMTTDLLAAAESVRDHS